MGPFIIKIIAFVCAQRFPVIVRIVGMTINGTGVKRRGIVRHSLEFSRLFIRNDDFVGNVQAGRKARGMFQWKDRR